MSEELPKEYLLSVDEMGAAFLGRLIPSIKLVQVKGLPMPMNESFAYLISPIIKPPLVTAEDVAPEDVE